MPQYLAPGVYIEEVAGARPIEGVGTATGAFVGLAERGPIGEAVLITNWIQFTETFGGFIPAGYLAYAVNQFFTEGGTRCYVVRTCHYTTITNATTAAARTAAVTLADRAATPDVREDNLRKANRQYASEIAIVEGAMPTRLAKLVEHRAKVCEVASGKRE